MCTGAPEDAQRVAAAGQGTLPGEASEPADVAVVRCCREQQQVPRAHAEFVGSFVPVGAPGSRVRFVDHHDVPRPEGQGVDDVALLQVVDRSDPHAGRIRRSKSTACVEPRQQRFDRLSADTEPRQQFLGPLGLQAGRDDDERLEGGATGVQVCEHETGLDRLAETHLVGDEQAAMAGQHGKQRFELVGPDVDARVDGGGRDACVWRPCEQVCEAGEALLRPHGDRPRVGSGGVRHVERREDCQAPVAVRDIEPDRVAIDTRAVDPPAAPPDTDARTRHGGM